MKNSTLIWLMFSVLACIWNIATDNYVWLVISIPCTMAAILIANKERNITKCDQRLT